jgi:iron complex transport system substrate-binding protein
VLSEPPTYYHELDSSFFSVTSGTFIGQVYAMAGLENIADVAEGAETLYPQLSAEFIIDSDPDLIFLADTKCCGESLETVTARPGWDQLTAVANGDVVELDDDVASRWGPRVVDFLAIIVDEVTALPAAA